MFTTRNKPFIVRENRPAFEERMPVHDVDENGVHYVHLENTCLRKVIEVQLPAEIDLKAIIESEELLRPSSSQVLKATDPYTRQSVGHSIASDMLNQLDTEDKLEPQSEPEPESEPEPVKIVES